MVGVSRLLLPLVASQSHVLGNLWQEIHRYGPKRDRFNATYRQNRANSIEITWRNSCKIATAANLTPLVAATYLVLANLNFRALDLSATSGTHVLNPSGDPTLNALNVTQITLSKKENKTHKNS